jgi:hypothetical protein
MTLNSETAAQRQAAYDRAVEALHRVTPKIAPVAKPTDAFAIPLVSQQAREAVAPDPAPASPERMLGSRVNDMWNAVVELVAKAKRKGIKVEFPPIKQSDDLGYQLQMLNTAHAEIEQQLEYYGRTTPAERMIETLRQHVNKLEAHSKRTDARLDAMARALASISELLPHLLPAPSKK